MTAARKPWAGSTRRARLPVNWQTFIVPTVLARDSHKCQIRGPKCTRLATQVDHIRRGDDHRMANLQAVCGPCHAAKSGREGAAARPRERRHPEAHPGIK